MPDDHHPVCSKAIPAEGAGTSLDTEIDDVIAVILVARFSGRTAAENCAIGGITASALTLRQQHRCGALTPSQRARSLVLSLTALDRRSPWHDATAKQALGCVIESTLRTTHTPMRSNCKLVEYEFFVMRSVSKFFLPLLLAPVFLTGTAHARVCNANTLADCDVTVGKVKYSNFSFSLGFTPNPRDSFSLLGYADGSGSIAFDLDPGRNEVNASFTYTVTLLQGPQFTHTFREVNVGADVEIASGGTVDTALNTSGLSQASYTKTGTIETAVPGVFNPGITSRIFTQSFSIVPSGNVDAKLFTVSNDWTTNSEPIPGPLPLLGAVTAFSLSRKLRRRIRSAG